MASPVLNLSRQFRSMREEYRSEYALHQPGRFRRTRTGVSSTPTSGDYHLADQSRHFYGIEYVRAMHRDDVIIKQTTRRAVQQQIQSGFTLDPQVELDAEQAEAVPATEEEASRSAPPPDPRNRQAGPDTGDAGLNRAIWQDFDDWANDPERCDISGERTFADSEAAEFEAMLVDGDVCSVGTEDGQLQTIEAHLLRTPNWTKKNVVLGVELDRVRRRLGYHFVNEEPGQPWRRTITVGQAPLVPTRDANGVRQVFHMLHADRVSLTRGLTAYHAVVDVAGMFDDANFALLVKQQMAACFTVFFEQTQQGPPFNPQVGPRDTQQLGTGPSLTDIVKEGIAPGQKIALPYGVKAEGYTPTIASSETMQHLRFLVQIIGLNLGMPLGLVLLDPTDASWSGLRTVMDSAKIGFKCNQLHFERRKHRPTYRWRLHWRMQQGDTFAQDLRRWHGRMGERLFRHRWSKPTWPYQQPLDDAKAKALRMSSLQSSPRREAAETSADFDELVDETIEDWGRAIERAKARAKQINDRYKEDPNQVTWRDLLNLDLYKGGVAFQSSETADERKPQGAKPAQAQRVGQVR